MWHRITGHPTTRSAHGCQRKLAHLCFLTKHFTWRAEDHKITGPCCTIAQGDDALTLQQHAKGSSKSSKPQMPVSSKVNVDKSLSGRHVSLCQEWFVYRPAESRDLRIALESPMSGWEKVITPNAYICKDLGTRCLRASSYSSHRYTGPLQTALLTKTPSNKDPKLLNPKPL